MLSFASAIEKEYDPATKTVKLNDNFWFLNTGDRATIQLLTPLVNYVNDGEDVLVIKYNITAFKDLEESFYGETKTYDKKRFDRGYITELGKQFTWRYLETYQEEIPTYDYETLNFTNGTSYLSRLQTGTKLINKERWVHFDKTKKKIYKKESLIIGLFTDVKQGDNMEFIPYFETLPIEEWATIVSTNGAETIDGNYTVITFTSDGYFNTTGDNLEAEVLVIGGGGGSEASGAGNSGGGGGGGYVYNSSHVITPGNYTVTVGAGGAINTNGGNSSFDALEAYGGGAGKVASGSAGGSGGGAGASGTGGAGYQGFAGGDSASGVGAGGGGSSEVGTPYDAAPTGGLGGDGLYNSINGTNVSYAGGGGGIQLGGGGAGGSGGGGAGGDGADNAENGTDGLGGGAGGNGWSGVGTHGGSGIVIIRYLTTADIDVNLISPEDNLTTTETYHNFSCNASYDSDIVNLTLYINGEQKAINESIGTFMYLSYSENLTTDGIYKWNCEAISLSNVTTTEDNRTLTIHTTSPSLIITAPNETIDYHLFGNNLTLNWTVTEGSENLTEHIKNCTYEYNGNITVLNNTLCTQINTTSFEYVLGQNNLTFNVTDDLDLVNSTIHTWNIKITEINQTYDNETIEGSTQNISSIIRLGEGETISAAILDYNGTLFSGTSTDSGENKRILKSELITPTVIADENITFHWSIILSGGKTINLTEKNQTIENLGIDNCSVFTNQIVNITILDEEEQTLIANDTTLEIALSILSSDRSLEVVSFSQEFEGVNPVSICLNQVIEPGLEYSLDSIMRYTATEYSNEYYNVVDMALTNETGLTEYDLYSLNETRSTEFQLTFKGDDFLPVEDALVFVERQYISEDVFKTVEVPKTDSNGQTVLHLVRNSVIYNLKFVKDDEILRVFNNVVAFCQDFTIGSCTMSLNAVSNESGIFNYDDSIGILYSSQPDYNITSQVVSFSFASTDGSTQNVFMEVQRRDVFGNRSICNNTVVSTSGTLSCTIEEDIDDTTLLTIISVDDKEWLTFSTVIDDTAYGSTGYVFWFILTLVSILMFGESKNGIMISLLLSYMGAVGLGVAIGGIVGVGSAGIWVMLITLAGIWKINKNRRSR